MTDNYQYQIQPLPPISVIGGNYTTAGQIANSSIAAISGSQEPTSAPPTFSGGGGSGGGGFVGVFVSNVTWDSGAGQLVVDFSNGSQTTIPFSLCP